MRPVRLLLAAVGVLLMIVGVWNLVLDRPAPADLVSLALWLGGGVVVHDLVIAPLAVVVGMLLTPRLPAEWRGAVVAGLVVLGSVTLTAVPVLGRFGAKADDPSLLNRPYGLLWLGFAASVAACVVVVVLVRRRRRVPS